MEGEAIDSGTPLFAIFVVSLLSLFLVPFTIYKLCNAASSDEAVKPGEAAANKRKGALGRFFYKLLSPSAAILLVGWILLFGLLWYVQHNAKDLSPFDPYDILKLDRGATEQEVKKAYRRLSLQFHPDKNSDPAAVPIFLQISQAYRALTDEVARKNWEKFGHPDGKQAMDIGIALPSWIMSNEKNGPMILAVLVIVGVVLPLGAAAWFLFSSSKYMGPNQIMQETLDIFVRSKFAVKESQSLARVPDTLVYAMEFIMLPTPSEQAAGLEQLRRDILRSHSELKDKPQFFKRKASIVKVHMLLLAHMDRMDIPSSLQKDMEFVLKKSTILLEEMIKIANIPRYSPYGWLTPTIGAVEMLQCLTQAVSIGSRKNFTTGKAGSDSQAPMLQLPHMELDVVKRLSRKRVRGLGDLLELDQESRLSQLESAGLSESQAKETVTALLSIPVVTVASAEFVVEGEEAGADVLEQDIVTCSARLLLKRPSHASSGFAARKGSSVLAYAPHCPVPREERWYAVLADPSNNATLTWVSVSLMEAESIGVELAQSQAHNSGVGTANGVAEAATLLANGDDKDTSKKTEQTVESLTEGKQTDDVGQLVELKFRAPRQGKYDLTLYIISDCWIGCDRAVPLKLKVNELTRAEREGRTHRGNPVPADEEVSGAEVMGSDGGNEEESEDEDYDSEEGSTEESGSEAGDAKDDDTDSQASSTEAPLLRDIEDEK